MPKKTTEQSGYLLLHWSWCWLICVFAVTDVGSAQVGSTSATSQARGEPIEASVADVNRLSRSLRRVESGLAIPVDFTLLMTVPGNDELLMRQHGALSAVFPRSVYVDSRSGPLPLIPPNTTFYIGKLPPEISPDPRDAPQILTPESLFAGMDDSVRSILEDDLDALSITLPAFQPFTDDDPRLNTRIDHFIDNAAEHDRSAAPSEEQIASTHQLPLPSRPQVRRSSPDEPVADGARGSILSDHEYRRKRLHELLEKAAAAELHSSMSR